MSWLCRSDAVVEVDGGVGLFAGEDWVPSGPACSGGETEVSEVLHEGQAGIPGDVGVVDDFWVGYAHQCVGMTIEMICKII